VRVRLRVIQVQLASEIKLTLKMCDLM
jgi:hypothetical protein